MGRRPVGKTAMTGAERVRRYRLKHGVGKPATKPARSVTGRPATKSDHATLVRELTLAKQELALLKVRIVELEAFALQIAEGAFGLLKPKRPK